MDIGTVIRTLKYKPDAKFRRAHWGENNYIYMIDRNSPSPKILISEGGHLERWLPTQETVLCEDWEEVISVSSKQPKI